MAVSDPRGPESVQSGAVDAASEAAPEREAYLARCRGLVERAVDNAVRNQGVAVTCGSIEGYVDALRQIDQVERRLVRGETIPHEEKVFSIFEEHTRWVSKGKATGRRV